MKCLIVGNGDYAKMICQYLEETNGIEVSGFTVDTSVIVDRKIDDKPVIPSDKVLESYSPDDCRLYMGIGYRNMSLIKAKEYKRYKELGYVFSNYIHPTAIIEKDVVMGEANSIFEGVIIQNGVRMGDGNHLYAGALVAHHSVIGDFNFFSVKTCMAGCSEMGNNCFVGANSTIRDHIRISDYTLVGAGAYADRNTNMYDVIVPMKSHVLEGKRSVDFI